MDRCGGTGWRKATLKSERGYLVPERQGQYGSKRILGAEAAFIVADAMSEGANGGETQCGNVEADALAYILRLEDHIGELTEMVRQLERERDAAVKDLYHAASGGESFCDICKYKGEPCDERQFNEMECWEWRGPQEVEP